jgi:prepilin-type N-terminal cleavage/methylation domain-containing protein/prepilin-type processing-associated H-X9-DG protein
MKQLTFTQRRALKSAFTLIELLVVIAIIAILAAILFPVFAQAKLAAKKSVDLSNVKQLALGNMMYLNDVDDAYPFCWGWGGNSGPWHQQVNPYVKNKSIWLSPVDNWGRGTEGNEATCNPGAPTRGVTYSMNYTWPAFVNSTGQWWGPNSEQCLMSPTCDSGGANESNVPSVASSILIAPRPNWYHQWCEGWATEVFFNYPEFNMQGGGATMFTNGTNYGLCDGHAKFMTVSATLAAQGTQASTSLPSYWPSDPINWPWPLGIWDKRQ